jgi:hypothetical protein
MLSHRAIHACQQGSCECFNKLVMVVQLHAERELACASDADRHDFRRFGIHFSS